MFKNKFILKDTLCELKIFVNSKFLIYGYEDCRKDNATIESWSNQSAYVYYEVLKTLWYHIVASFVKNDNNNMTKRIKCKYSESNDCKLKRCPKITPG